MKSLSRSLGLFVVGGALVGLTACNTSVGVGTTVSVTSVGTVPWVAVQDGSGAWHALAGSSFIVKDGAGRYGVAWQCTQPSGQPLVRITQETTADGTAVTASCQGPGSTGAGSVVGAVLNIPVSGKAFVAAGSHATTVDYAGSGVSVNYTLNGVSAGAQTTVSYGITSGGAFAKMQRQGITVSGTVTNSINAGAGYSVTLSYGVSVAGLPAGETPTSTVELAPASTPPVILATASSTSLPYPLVPGGLAQPGDRYVLIGTGKSSTSATSVTQTAAYVAQSPSNGDVLLLPAALSTSAGVGVTGGSGNASWGAVSFAGSGLTGFTAAVTPSTLSSAAWSVTVTGSWLGSATSYDFPDFSSTVGWNSAWGFPTAQSATAAVQAVHANVTLDELLAYSQAANDSSLPDGTSLDVTARSATGTY